MAVWTGNNNDDINKLICDIRVNQESGLKFDRGKPMVSLIDPDWLLDVSAVLTYGMKKYSKDNWKHVDDHKDRYLSAAYRHLLAFQSGEVNDPESGFPHLAHATCCLMFLHHMSAEKVNKTCVANGHTFPEFVTKATMGNV